MHNKLESNLEELETAAKETIDSGNRFLYIRHKLVEPKKLVLWTISIENKTQLNKTIKDLEQLPVNVFKLCLDETHERFRFTIEDIKEIE